MLFYYFAYAAISASLVFITTIPLLTVTGIVLGIHTAYGTKRFNFSDKSKYVLAVYVITVIQVINALVYYVELRTVTSNASILQAFSYAGSANLKLFVSLTPWRNRHSRSLFSYLRSH